MRRPPLRSSLCLLLLGLLTCLSPQGEAQARGASPASDVVEVAEGADFDALVKKANAAFAKQEYDDAIALFDKAYALDPVPNLLYNLGRIHEQKGDFPSAIDSYRKFIASPGVDHDARQDAITRLKTLLEVVELTGGGEPIRSPPPVVGGQVNINTADSAQLQSLKGIGPSKARAIITERETNGPFSSVEALTRVRGIGKKTLEKLRPHITTGSGAAPPSPDAPAPTPTAGAININTATAAELANLNGIGPSKARAIITEREANGLYDSCDALSRVRGIGAGTIRKLASQCRAE